MAKIVLQLRSPDYGFETSDEQGNTVKTDTSIENGGTNFGFRPMQLLLAALGSCSGIDLVSILKKQRQEIRDLKIEINGERENNVTPSLWKEIHVNFIVWSDAEPDKIKKAADLSMEKYCSVAETLRRGGTVITWQTIVKRH